MNDGGQMVGQLFIYPKIKVAVIGQHRGVLCPVLTQHRSIACELHHSSKVSKILSFAANGLAGLEL